MTFADTFQDAKDSFYVALRDRLAALNPDRVATVRGAQRPAVVVAENEMEAGAAEGLRETFALHWGAVTGDASEALVLEQARCTVRWSTAGSPEMAGMDRGRVLQAMRAELDGMLQPRTAGKQSYATGKAVACATPVCWSDVLEETVTETAGLLVCACAVAVFAWKEAA